MHKQIPKIRVKAIKDLTNKGLSDKDIAHLLELSHEQVHWTRRKYKIPSGTRLANCMKNSASFNQIETFSKNVLNLINYYKSQGSLGDITDVFPNIKLLET